MPHCTHLQEKQKAKKLAKTAGAGDTGAAGAQQRQEDGGSSDEEQQQQQQDGEEAPSVEQAALD